MNTINYLLTAADRRGEIKTIKIKAVSKNALKEYCKENNLTYISSVVKAEQVDIRVLGNKKISKLLTSQETKRLFLNTNYLVSY